jgi:hypothetical protein
MNLLSTAISAVLPIKLAEDAQCRKEAYLLTEDVAIKFMMESLGNENPEIVTELQMASTLYISHRRTNLLQILQYFQSGTQDDSELFPRISNDTTAKISLRVIKRLSPSENDGQNSTFEDQKETEHQCFANSFQNNKLLDSNEIQSLKDKPQSTRKES